MPRASTRVDLAVFVGRHLEEHDGDMLWSGSRVLFCARMGSEAADLVGTHRCRRIGDCTAYCNGTQPHSNRSDHVLSTLTR
jgi:hypothetical protein